MNNIGFSTKAKIGVLRHYDRVHIETKQQQLHRKVFHLVAVSLIQFFAGFCASIFSFFGCCRSTFRLQVIVIAGVYHCRHAFFPFFFSFSFRAVSRSLFSNFNEFISKYCVLAVNRRQSKMWKKRQKANCAWGCALACVCVCLCASARVCFCANGGHRARTQSFNTLFYLFVLAPGSFIRFAAHLLFKNSSHPIVSCWLTLAKKPERNKVKNNTQ